ncbi:MAG: hypothetical protein LC111_10925 [Bacteroidia bacterium]|nr:hypothetical protein [Bacteroidia bacterium]
MAKGVKTGGRQKGTPNKVTKAAKDAIAEVAERLGGPDRMLAWAQEDPVNERIFWQTIYTKILPLQLTGADGRSLAQELAGLNGIVGSTESRPPLA